MAVRFVYILAWTVVSMYFVHTAHTMITHTGDTATTESSVFINSTRQQRQTTSKRCDLKTKLIVCYLEKNRCVMGKCHTNYTICEVQCKCVPGVEGERCNHVIAHNHGSSTDPTPGQVNSTSSLHGNVNSTATTDQNQTIATSYDINGSTTEQSTKLCLNGLPCVHGACVDEGYCNCTKGWTYLNCNVHCNLTCVRGVCKIKTDRTMHCNCPYRYTGDYCEITRPEPNNSTYAQNSTVTILGRAMADQRYIAGVVLGSVVVLCIIAVVMCWLLWKRRARILLKLIYWAKSYEDDDFKLYDAFVSFKSSTSDEMHQSSPEELFVMNTLMPKLETELGFRLCVHFRDFIPGKAIVENVLEAIENSRRTILLLSPSYIQDSFWTRFEYEQAQVAAMERKQRIIPIIFEDISDVNIEDITLRHILKSITYIKWPGYEDDKRLDEFWERVTLTMPKLLSTKPESEENTPQPDEEKVKQGIDDTLIAKTLPSNGPYLNLSGGDSKVSGLESESIAIEISNEQPGYEKIDTMDAQASRLISMLEPKA